MSVLVSDLKMYQATTMPTSLTAPTNIGGVKSATQITGGSIGEVHFTMSSALVGGGDKVQRSKYFYGNDSAADDLTSAVIWLPNALDDSAAGNFTTSDVSSSASDGSGKKVRRLGYDQTGAAVQEEQVLNGTSEVTGSQQFSDVHRREIRNSSTGALEAAAGSITHKRNSVTQGETPAGYYGATSEIDIWLPSTLSDSSTAGDAGSDPTGASWSRPRTFATGEAVANSGTLTHGQAQGIWSRWTLKERAKASADVQVITAIQGNTA